jgi:hypothetical protein
MMKTLQLIAYICVIVAVLVHHIPVLRAALEVATDAHYYEMAKNIGLWEE